MTAKVRNFFTHPKAHSACWRLFLIETLQKAEVPDPEGCVSRALQRFNREPYAAQRFIDRLVDWKKEGLFDCVPNAETRFWEAYEEVRKG